MSKNRSLPLAPLARHARELLALPAFGLWLLLFLVPISILAVYSFGETNLLTFNVEFGWTLDNYKLLTESIYLKPIVLSVGMALVTTLVCFLVGFPVAYYISTKSGRVQKLLLLAVIVPFWSSFVVRAYAWIGLMQNGGPIDDAMRWLGLTDGSINLLGSRASILIVMVYTYIPLMIFPLYVALERIDTSLPQAAADLGSGTWRTMRRVIVPLAKPGIYAGSLLVAVPAIGEFTIPFLIGGGKTLMFGNIIADQFRTVGDYSAGGALSVSLVVVVVVAVVFLRRRAEEQPA